MEAARPLPRSGGLCDQGDVDPPLRRYEGDRRQSNEPLDGGVSADPPPRLQGLSALARRATGHFNAPALAPRQRADLVLEGPTPRDVRVESCPSGTPPPGRVSRSRFEGGSAVNTRLGALRLQSETKAGLPLAVLGQAGEAFSRSCWLSPL